MTSTLNQARKGKIEVLTERSPLIVVVFEGAADDQQFADYLLELDRILTHGRHSQVRHAMVVDTLAATRPVTPRQRQMQADWMKKNHARSKAQMAGMAFVMNNVLVRGVLTAILWFQEMPCEFTVVATREQAEAWARAKIVAASPANAMAKAG